ncbi:hypothetical protein AGMMS4952_27850 [Spirochaetia bacterium]|nr:hypothetical protein AGMMS4952_27850 [Spirochaetia bacterium]
MKRNFLSGVIGILLVSTLALAGCDTGGGDSGGGGGTVFSSDTLAATSASLGFATATSATSDNVAVATVSTGSTGSVTITSVGVGSATITVFDAAFNDATVTITVASDGKITETGRITYKPSETVTFTADTITVPNTEAQLGLVGTAYEVTPEGHVAVAIAGSEVTITSISGNTGSAVITVKTGGTPVHEAAIAVTVTAKGKVILGAISKYDLTPNGKTYYDGYWGKFEFSAVSAGTSGTYFGYENRGSGDGPSWQQSEEGSYSWNPDTKKVTLTPTKRSKKVRRRSDGKALI